MTQPAPSWPNNGALLLRLLYQRCKVLGGLSGLIPRALDGHEIVAGRSEFMVVGSVEADGAGWDGGMLLLPRTYSGYVAIHYAKDTDQHETFEDEARVTAAVASFTEDVRAQQIPGLRGLGLVPGRWFLNDTPVKQELPAVYTLSIDWELGVDLRIPAGFARGTP